MKAIEEAAPKEVSRSQRDYGQRSDLFVFRPIEFCAAAGMDIVTRQNGTYTKRGEPARLPKSVHLSKMVNRACTQMIVVIVRNNHCINRRQILKRESRRESHTLR